MVGPPQSRRARRIAAGLLVVLLGAAVLGGYLYERHRTGSVYHPRARFVPQPSPTLPARGPARHAWPFYGYSADHTRFFPAPARLSPPFQTLWVHHGGSLLELPPSLHGDHIFQLADDGVLSAIDVHTGRTFWQRRIGSLSASTPAAVGDVVYATVLARPDGVKQGEVLALAYATGKVLWSRALPSPSESSPLLAGGLVYLRLPERHRLRAERRQRRGRLDLSRRRRRQGQPDAVRRNALLRRLLRPRPGVCRARTGRRIWDSGSEGALLGSGTFYSTAAVMYGRVFLGNTDGRIYAYDAFTRPARLGGADRRLRVLLARDRQRPRSRPHRSTSAPTTAPSTR